MTNAGSETSRRRREIVNSSFITSPFGLTHVSGERTASRLSQTSFFVGGAAREGPFDFSRLAVVASLAQVIGGGPMKQIVQFLILALAVSTAASASAWAQSTAQITGTVKDASGAVLPGVEVTATQTETGIARSTVSNETGVYVLPNLTLGPYKLEASLAGFRTFVRTGIVLQVHSKSVINVTLPVDQVSA